MAKVTAAFAEFAGARFYDIQLLHLIDSRVSHQDLLDHVRKRFDPPPVTESEVSEAAEHLRQFIYQIQWTRAVDSFQRYLADVLRDVLRAKPEIMRSGETITYEEVLTAPDLPTLVASLMERIVGSLVGLKQIETWFEKRKIPFVVTPDERKVLGEAIATRNIIVHNAAVVNKKYMDEFASRGFTLGDRRGIAFDELLLIELLVKTVAANTDSAIVAKYDIGIEVPGVPPRVAEASTDV